MIEIFTETLNEFTHETNSIPKYIPLSVSSPSQVQKTYLGVHDRGLSPLQKNQKSSRDANWTVISDKNAAAGGSLIGEGSTRSCKSHSGKSSQSVSDCIDRYCSIAISNAFILCTSHWTYKHLCISIYA
jgi:hypothetical protein